MENHKFVIYQVFTRLFGNSSTACKEYGTIAENGCGKMNFFNDTVLGRIKKLGATHVWYTGIIRHATATDYSSFGIPRQHPAVVKGKAGSPYAITDYYDVDPDLAEDVESRMQEFEDLVSRSHRKGLKVITDFVPNHVARQYKSVSKPQGVKDLGEDDDKNMGFSTANNFYYCPGCQLEPYFDLNGEDAEPYREFPAKATGNDHFDNRPSITDWYETVKLNYGIDYCDAGGRSYHFDPIPDTWFKMKDIVLFWAGKGIDGFRCDMAEMVPSAFWKWMIAEVRRQYPDLIFIGEVYNPSLYREYISSGFDYLYDKVGMYDCLCRVMCGKEAATGITCQWQAVDDIKDHMLYFLENHDELRIASDFLAGDARKGIPALITSVLMNRNPFMLYAGQEYGERGMDKEGFSGRDGRTTIFDYWTVDSLYHGYVNRRKLAAGEKELEKIYSCVLNMARTEPAVYAGEFFDLMYANPASEHFNPYSQYAFLRKHGNEVILVVVNFSDRKADCKVSIPKHAFDYLRLAEGTVVAVDLLNKDSMDFSLQPNLPISISVEAHSGRAYKFVVEG